MSVIAVNNLSKIYKLYNKPVDRLKEAINPLKKIYHTDFYALNNVSFNVKKGECLGIIGTNGSGKSTLLKIITGVLTPSNGSVSVNGRISAILELGAGFNPEYTGMENIYLNGTIMGYSKEEMDVRVSDILSFADIGQFIGQPVKTYSSGMFARLAFAVAINVSPDILIVDEALSVGDIFFQVKCFAKFKEFIKMGKTILFVSHDINAILKYCNRAILINNGNLLTDTTPKSAVEMYKKILVNITEQQEEVAQTVVCDGEMKSQIRLNPKYIEYGNNKAVIYDVALKNKDGKFTNYIEVNEMYEIIMKIEFRDTVKNPIFAYSVKDAKGVEVVGTNSMLENIDTGTFKSGDKVTVTFSQRFNLNTMEWLVSFGCTGFENDKFVVYNRKYDYVPIYVLTEKDAVGYVNPCSDIKIEIR